MKNNPFIHVFKTPFFTYAYDVNTDSVIKISKELYDYLMDLEHGVVTEKTEEVHSEMEILKKKGYLKEFYPKKIVDPRLSQLDYLINNRVEGITLQVTQQCNMRCSYCKFTYGDNIHNRAHATVSMSYDVAVRAIDFYYHHSRDSKRVNVSFYGGEPLLEYEMIKKIVSYVNDKFEGKDISFNMTTNAILLTPERLKYLVKNNVSIMVSLDGSEEIQNRSRKLAGGGKGSYEIVVKQLKHLKETCPVEYKEISFNSVIDPLYDMTPLLKFYQDDIFKGALINLGNEKVAVGDSSINTPIMDTPEGTTSGSSEIFFLSMREAELIALYSLIGLVDDKKLSPISLNIKASLIEKSNSLVPANQLEEYSAKGGPCIPGVHNTFVRVDGKFFPCEKVCDISDDLNIGDVDSGYNYENIKRILNIGKITESKCTKCWAIRHCTSCVLNGTLAGKISKDMIIANCNGSKARLENTLKDLLAIDELRSVLLKGQIGDIHSDENT